jgi:hypothetical protein
MMRSPAPSSSTPSRTSPFFFQLRSTLLACGIGLLSLFLWASHPARAQTALPGDEPPAAAIERPSPGHWKDGVFRFFYNGAHHPGWLTDDQARAWVIEAAKQWEVCGVRVEFQGDTDKLPGARDGANVVGWRTDMPPQLRGITMGRQAEGALLERDIAWSPERLEFQRFPRLLRKVLVHEFGHAIGLTHSARCDDVMTLAASCRRMAPAELPVVPTPHDVERCKALYARVP